jgi:hypothetical protein
MGLRRPFQNKLAFFGVIFRDQSQVVTDHEIRIVFRLSM